MWLLLACTPDAPARPTPAAAPDAPFAVVRVADIPQITAVQGTPGGPDALLLTEQRGRLWRVDARGATELLDLGAKVASGGETGLLGLAIHPRWPDDPRVFVNYTTRDGGRLATRVVSLVVPAEGAVDPASEVLLLTFPQPWSNHNSGALAFGADGHLYVGVGDGGSGGDPLGTGQDRSDWLGSILRLDVSVAPYRVPADNPFVGEAGVKPEIWAYGVRNPWGMHADGDTLWFADVGQNRWEEVNVGRAGGNYGWNRLEGTHCYEADACVREGTVLPVAEYGHDLGQSVTGGFVYRGPSIPALDGRYVYADFASGVFQTVTPGGAPAVVWRSALHPSAFGRDRQGRMYVADYGSGVYRLDPPGSGR